MRTYWSKERPHLSYSQIKSYVRSPVLYKLRHVDGSNKFKVTDQVKFGKLVDAMLTDPSELKKFSVSRGERGLSDAEKEWRVTEDAWEKAETLACHIRSQPFWNVKKKFQVVLEGEIGGVKVCGMADASFVIDGQPCLLDLKTTGESRIRNENAWFWHSSDMMYHVQAGIYRELYRQKFGMIPYFYHVVASVDGDGMPSVRLFRFSDAFADEGLRLAREAIAGILAGKFDGKPVSWEDSKILGAEYGEDLQGVPDEI